MHNYFNEKQCCKHTLHESLTFRLWTQALEFLSPKLDRLPKARYMQYFQGKTLLPWKQFYYFNCISYCSIYTGEFYLNFWNSDDCHNKEAERGNCEQSYGCRWNFKFLNVDYLCLMKSACNIAHFSMTDEVEEFRDIWKSILLFVPKSRLILLEGCSGGTITEPFHLLYHFGRIILKLNVYFILKAENYNSFYMHTFITWIY